MRHKNSDWSVEERPTLEGAQLTVLMDIRDELQALNRLLNCHNFTEIPHVLRGIRAKLPTKKRKKRNGRNSSS